MNSICEFERELFKFACSLTSFNELLKKKTVSKPMLALESEPRRCLTIGRSVLLTIKFFLRGSRNCDRVAENIARKIQVIEGRIIRHSAPFLCFSFVYNNKIICVKLICPLFVKLSRILLRFLPVSVFLCILFQIPRIANDNLKDRTNVMSVIKWFSVVPFNVALATHHGSQDVK